MRSPFLPASPPVEARMRFWPRAKASPFIETGHYDADHHQVFRCVVPPADLPRLQEELSEYLLISVTPSSNFSAFWVSHAQQWPVLSAAALNLLALPVSSANVERAFSNLTLLQRKERCAMSPESLNMYLAIYFNRFRFSSWWCKKCANKMLNTLHRFEMSVRFSFFFCRFSPYLLRVKNISTGKSRFVSKEIATDFLRRIYEILNTENRKP